MSWLQPHAQRRDECHEDYVEMEEYVQYKTHRSIQEAAVVASQAGHLPAVPAVQFPIQLTAGSPRKASECTRRPGRSAGLLAQPVLASACVGVSCCSHLRSERAGGTFLSSSASQNKTKKGAKTSLKTIIQRVSL